MKTNAQLLKQLQELTKGLTKVKPKKQLTSKQLESLKKGRVKLIEKRTNLSKSTVGKTTVIDKVVNTLHFSSLLGYLLSYISFVKSILYKVIAFILVTYFKLKSASIYNIFKTSYFIIGIVMFLFFNYNHVDYTHFLIYTYDSMIGRMYDQLGTCWSIIKEKIVEFLTGNSSNNSQISSDTSITKDLKNKIYDQVKQDFIDEIGQENYNKLKKSYRDSLNRHWYDPIFDTIVDIKDLSWQDFLTSKYFWVPIGTIAAGSILYYNLDSIKDVANNLPIPGVVVTAYVKFKYWLPSWARRGPFANPFDDSISDTTVNPWNKIDGSSTVEEISKALDGLRTPTPPHLPAGMNTYFKDEGFEEVDLGVSFTSKPIVSDRLQALFPQTEGGNVWSSNSAPDSPRSTSTSEIDIADDRTSVETVKPSSHR